MENCRAWSLGHDSKNHSKASRALEKSSSTSSTVRPVHACTMLLFTTSLHLKIKGLGLRSDEEGMSQLAQNLVSFLPDKNIFSEASAQSALNPGLQVPGQVAQPEHAITYMCHRDNFFCMHFHGIGSNICHGYLYEIPFDRSSRSSASRILASANCS